MRRTARGGAFLVVLVVTLHCSVSSESSNSEDGGGALCALPTSVSLFLRKGSVSPRKGTFESLFASTTTRAGVPYPLLPASVLRLRGHGSSDDDDVYSAEEEGEEIANDEEKIDSTDLEVSEERVDSDGNLFESSDEFNEKRFKQYAQRDELSEADVQFLKLFDKKKWKKAVEAVELRLQADKEALPPEDPPAKWTEMGVDALAWAKSGTQRAMTTDAEENFDDEDDMRIALRESTTMDPELYPPEQWEADVTLWMAAIEGDNEEILRAVRELGADVNSSNPLWRHFRAVHYAAVNEQHSTLVLLVEELGADVDPWDFQLYTPLLRAARMGSLPTVKLLVALGADTRLRTCTDESALDIALVYDFHDMYVFLRKCVGREDDSGSEEEEAIDESKVNLEGWIYDVAKKIEKNKRAWNRKLQLRLEAGIGAPLPGRNGTRNHDFPWGTWKGHDGCSEGSVS